MVERVNDKASLKASANRRNLRFFIHDRSGSAAVEFGMIAAPFLLLIVAILEYAFGNFAQSRLDAAVARTARQVMTGYVDAQKVGGAPLTAQQFRDQIVCKNLPAMLKCADIYVDVAAFKASSTAYDAYVNDSKSGLIMPRLDATNGYCIGTKDTPYVVLRVAYPAPVLATAALYPNAITYKGRKARLLTAVATFRNEPFQNQSSGS